MRVQNSNFLGLEEAVHHQIKGRDSAFTQVDASVVMRARARENIAWR